MAADRQRKSFWETGTWRFLKEKAPDAAGTLLKTAGSLTGVELLTKAGELIDGSPEVSADDKLAFLEMRQLELEEYRLEVEDRASARQREADLAKAGKRDYFMYVVGGVGMLSFCFLHYAIAFMDIPEENEQLFTHLVGMVEGVAITIFAYYFGSSRGSKEKTEMLGGQQ